MTLVSIIVPAYNAEETIAETLQSALHQTYAATEIIVVDDGSTDGTRRIAEEYSERHSKISLIVQANGGVASARNRAIERATGDFIAPLDADDLWHPTKIEQQVKRFSEASPDTALVYNWFRYVDEQGLVFGRMATPKVEGWVLYRHLAENFISNGSTPLIRRHALENLRYDRTLHDSGNQGCEDYLLQLRIATKFQFACVPEFLTGYRQSRTGMRSNTGQMIRSHIQVLETMAALLGLPAQPVLSARLGDFKIQLARNSLKRGRMSEATAKIAQAFSIAPRHSAYAIADQFALAVNRMYVSPKGPHGSEERSHFQDWPVDAGIGEWVPTRLERLPSLALLDSSYAPLR